MLHYSLSHIVWFHIVHALHTSSSFGFYQCCDKTFEFSSIIWIASHDNNCLFWHSNMNNKRPWVYITFLQYTRKVWADTACVYTCFLYIFIMKRTRPLLITSRLCRPLLHFMLILGSFYGVILLRAHTDLIPWIQLRIPPIAMRETMLFAWWIWVTFIVIGAVSGLYALFTPVQHYYRTFTRVWLFWLMISACIAYLWFWYVFVNGISRFVLMIGAVVFFVWGTIVDLVMNAFQYYLERQQPYAVLLIWWDTLLCEKVQKILAWDKIYAIDRVNSLTDSWIESMYDIVIVAGKMSLSTLQDIADAARIQWQRFYHIWNELYLEDLIATPERLWSLIALAYSSSPLQWRWRVVKRVIDIIGASVGLILLFPFFVLISFLIVLDSKGSILYKQSRVWKNKKKFTFIKFRTMYTHMSVWAAYGGDEAQQMYTELIHSEKNVRDTILPKIEDDPRVTRVGRFLRKTSIDELPSLWSVLLWDMSLVGPRPHMPSEVDRYDTWQERLFSLKPWITWYAQIFWRDQLPFEEEATLDLYYIQNRSVGLDIYVLINTLRVVCSWR